MNNPDVAVVHEQFSTILSLMMSVWDGPDAVEMIPTWVCVVLLPMSVTVFPEIFPPKLFEYTIPDSCPFDVPVPPLITLFTIEQKPANR